MVGAVGYQARERPITLLPFDRHAGAWTPRVRLRRTRPCRHWQQAASGTLGAQSLLGIGIPHLRAYGAENALISQLDPSLPDPCSAWCSVKLVLMRRLSHLWPSRPRLGGYQSTVEGRCATWAGPSNQHRQSTGPVFSPSSSQAVDFCGRDRDGRRKSGHLLVPEFSLWCGSLSGESVSRL